uniref:Uncharacterized protein n=1 Tax=Aegilops tauschii TaxID=37682 RepID=R7VZ48_AEGTA
MAMLCVVTLLKALLGFAQTGSSCFREASAGRLLRPGRDVSSDSELKDQAIVDKYAPLLPTMLPRGLAPPSAPSGGTNEAGN